MLGLHCWAWAFSSYSKWGLLFIAVCGLLIVVGHRLQAGGLSSCGTHTLLPRGMWNLLGPGIKPVSPALADGFLSTAPPGKSRRWVLNHWATKEISSHKLLNILVYIFSVPFSLSSPSGTLITHILDISILFHRSLTLCHLFPFWCVFFLSHSLFSCFQLCIFFFTWRTSFSTVAKLVWWCWILLPLACL